MDKKVNIFLLEKYWAFPYTWNELIEHFIPFPPPKDLKWNIDYADAIQTYAGKGNANMQVGQPAWR